MLRTTAISGKITVFNRLEKNYLSRKLVNTNFVWFDLLFEVK